MRNVTKAWLVLADEEGPITGLELPNIVLWQMTARDEPILWDMINSWKLGPAPEFELEIKLTNLGPFVERTPPPNANDRPRNWKPKGSREITEAPKEIEA